MLIKELVNHLDELLQPNLFKDYCPNGLQIAGKSEVGNIVCGVSLTEELVDRAVEQSADAIIVHHGVFWNGDDYRITGYKYKRIAKLIKHDINLIAYHLPLDNHATLGNNIQLAKLLKFENIRQNDKQNLLWFGELAQTMTIEQFAEVYQKLTNHKPIYFAHPQQKIKKVALCTGGAVSLFNEASTHDIDLYITGEVKENIMAQSLESDVAYIAGGHYVTERYGIQALSKYLNDNLGIASQFIELYNPI
jgi:dinuclear metal center YbgI/SA1388 family protein